MTLARAAEICDVNHFNWTQMVTALPSDDMAFMYPGPAFPPQPIPYLLLPIIDPIPSSILLYGVHSNIAQATDPADYPDGNDSLGAPPGGFDNFNYYENEVPLNPISFIDSYYYNVNPLIAAPAGTPNGNATTSNALLFYDAADAGAVQPPSAGRSRGRGRWCYLFPNSTDRCLRRRNGRGLGGHPDDQLHLVNQCHCRPQNRGGLSM